MKWFARFAVLIFVLVVAMTMVHLGQPRAQGNPDDEKPKNLKVLPKNMSHREVVQVMRGFSIALGARCEDCHYQKSPDAEPDFDSDKNPMKDTARGMMKMTANINEQIGHLNLKDSLQVSCVTCHHGVKLPQTLGSMMMQTTHQKGADAAIADYRKLRDQYYGSAAYNFAPQTLNDVAVQLAEGQHDFDDAMKFLNLNLEFTPKDANTYLAMARVQGAKGDKAAATASIKKALEIDPDNRFAKRMLQQVQGGQ